MLNLPSVVSVECYSGYTFAERPVAFVWRGQRYRIKRIIRQWRSPQGSGFRIVVSGDQQLELIYTESQDEWLLRECRTANANGSDPSSNTADRKEKENNAQLCV